MLSHAKLLRLRRLNTPTVYNGWEQITDQDIARHGFNIEEVHDFMPQMGPMVGYAVTVVIEPSQELHKKELPSAWNEYRRYIASVPGPKIVVVQDLDKPNFVGAFWGEVNSNTHRVLGCVGTITDGAIRDLDEMCNAGFKALAKRLCVGHAHSWPVRWNCEVEVFGRRIKPGQLVHADKHGFLAISLQEEDKLLDAALTMDGNECDFLLPTIRGSFGKITDDLLKDFDDSVTAFSEASKRQFQKYGEW